MKYHGQPLIPYSAEIYSLTIFTVCRSFLALNSTSYIPADKWFV